MLLPLLLLSYAAIPPPAAELLSVINHGELVRPFCPQGSAAVESGSADADPAPPSADGASGNLLLSSCFCCPDAAVVFV